MKKPCSRCDYRVSRWRRRRDLNPRGAFYTPYSLSRGAPSATWVLLHIAGWYQIGGESGIRTHGCFHIAGFQDRCFRPLSHLSVCKSTSVPRRISYTNTSTGGCQPKSRQEKRKNFNLGLAFRKQMWYSNQADLSGKTEYPGVAKFGIALEWGSRGLEFESRHSDHEIAYFD